MGHGSWIMDHGLRLTGNRRITRQRTQREKRLLVLGVFLFYKNIFAG
jgi:hypothetical protein